MGFDVRGQHEILEAAAATTQQVVVQRAAPFEAHLPVGEVQRSQKPARGKTVQVRVDGRERQLEPSLDEAAVHLLGAQVLVARRKERRDRLALAASSAAEARTSPPLRARLPPIPPAGNPGTGER